MRDKILIKEKMQKLIEMITEFCDAYLNDEYKQLCEKLIKKMSRKKMYHFFPVEWKFGQRQ